jgi:hypothetical protein
MASKQPSDPADTVKLSHPERGTKIRVAADAAAKYLAQGFKAGSAKATRGTTAPSLSDTPSETWTVKQLREYADANVIDLAGATRKDDILAVIAATADPDRLPDGQDDDEDQDDEEDDGDNVELDGQDDDETE